MRPKSEIYTPKPDDEHSRPFHVGVPPLVVFHTPETIRRVDESYPRNDIWDRLGGKAFLMIC